MQHGEANLVEYEALDYKIKQIETKDYNFKNRLLQLQILADKKLNITNIYALVINNYQMEIGLYNI